MHDAQQNFLAEPEVPCQDVMPFEHHRSDPNVGWFTSAGRYTYVELQKVSYKAAGKISHILPFQNWEISNGQHN